MCEKIEQFCSNPTYEQGEESNENGRHGLARTNSTNSGQNNYFHIVFLNILYKLRMSFAPKSTKFKSEIQSGLLHNLVY